MSRSAIGAADAEGGRGDGPHRRLERHGSLGATTLTTHPGVATRMQETRRRVLDALADGPVTGPELAERLDVSRAAVWKHVEALREAGFEVEGTDDGYVLDRKSVV